MIMVIIFNLQGFLYVMDGVQTELTGQTGNFKRFHLEVLCFVFI